MSRYIKVEDMRAIFCQSNSLTQAWNGFDMLPSIDIVRCKECKWRDNIGCALEIVDDSDKPKDDDFCSYGEREGE